MAEVKKSRIFLRRGTDASRLGTVLCEGELGYSTNGQRVFVGDSSTLGGNSLGTTVFLLPATSATDPTADPFTTVETLTAVTDNGRAEVGDLAFVPASSYNLSSFNSGIQAGETEDTTATPADTFGTLYVLSARDGGTGDLTWVVANSGIPVSHLDIPDNSIAGDKIHGGEISGDVTFSGTVSTVSLTSTSSKVHDLSGTGSRVVFADSDGLLSTPVASNIITSTQYFDRIQLTNSFVRKTSTGTLSPQPLDGDWTTFDLTSHLSSLSLPVTYPKSAIINVYHTETQAQGDRRQYGLFSAHSTSNYSTEGNFYLQARWGTGEDAGGGADLYSWGSQIFVRMNGSTNNLILQYMDIHGSENFANTNLTVDLIGVQY